MNREVDTLTESQLRRAQSRDLMLNVLERVSTLSAGGQPRARLPETPPMAEMNEEMAFSPDDGVPIMPGETDTRSANPDNRVGRHSWGGHANGHIPLDAMTNIGSGRYLENNAAAAFQAMQQAAAAEGVRLRVVSAYRDYDSQVTVRQTKGHEVATATPGTSIHGWGRAIDVSGEKAQAWMRANASRFGFYWPEWAQRVGTKSYEPWHWEFGGKPAGGTVSAPPGPSTAPPAPPTTPLPPEGRPS